MNYFWLTNLATPVDDTDGVFLNVLADYRLGPPQATPQKSRQQLVLDGIIGVYTTEEAMKKEEVQKLTWLDEKQLSMIALGDEAREGSNTFQKNVYFCLKHPDIPMKPSPYGYSYYCSECLLNSK